MPALTVDQILLRNDEPQVIEQLDEYELKSELKAADHAFLSFRMHNSALIRPLEELLHKKCSTLRGELDSSTPRVSGVLRTVVVEG